MTTALDPGTKDGREHIMNAIVHATADRFVQLYERWQDEKDYEDWDEYASILMECVQKELPTGSTVAKPRKGSFKVVCTIPGFPYQPSVGFMNRSSIGWSAPR